MVAVNKIKPMAIVDTIEVLQDWVQPTGPHKIPTHMGNLKWRSIGTHCAPLGRKTNHLAFEDAQSRRIPLLASLEEHLLAHAYS